MNLLEAIEQMKFGLKISKDSWKVQELDLSGLYIYLYLDPSYFQYESLELAKFSKKLIEFNRLKTEKGITFAIVENELIIQNSMQTVMPMEPDFLNLYPFVFIDATCIAQGEDDIINSPLPWIFTEEDLSDEDYFVVT